MLHTSSNFHASYYIDTSIDVMRTEITNTTTVLNTTMNEMNQCTKYRCLLVIDFGIEYVGREYIEREHISKFLVYRSKT
jgi:hypothetical protein